ncbi:colanic acid biosynthesis acetyltransferase wcaB [Citrobacter sp. Marseille-Q6884]|uniref:colanic acid biosynthesis acetyltransferase wcaB n=1 Tax=Citrobacter sp. Marseille-Q6884 TaxID=2956786 RepID=UPI0021B22BEC|nr:colanic acid biosynthesis acetyltransferase wcaB [Citrobacter sp. Marseille-Q6884]
MRSKWARKINRMLVSKYNTEIMLGAKIGGGLRVYHFNGAVINAGVTIGKNFRIGQNTTIGEKHGIVRIKIGDNVEIGANSCIVADELTIGDNVIIGAMSFIDKDIPSNCTVYTKKTNVIKMRS